jgi:nucleoside-diphosphate-sugar epimerase
MKAVIIGGTGHVGTYLVPRLVQMGCDVTVVSRGQREPYQQHGAWTKVTHVHVDRAAAEADGSFGQRIAELAPDVVVDMICFAPASCRQLVDALQGKVKHFLHCGTIWVHGPAAEVPTRETQPRRPFGHYGIEAMLLAGARAGNLPATVLHPGHIVGPGWAPINPAGHNDPAVFEALASGAELALPNLGLETLQHVHADDVAAAFVGAITHWSTSVGESFHAVSEGALTLRGYAEAVAGWFGREANLEFLPYEQWAAGVDEKLEKMTLDHIAHSPHCSIDKARRLIDYRPRYTALEAVRESLQWLIDHGRMKI